MTDSDIENISQQLSEDFSKDTIKLLKEDLLKQQTLIQNVYDMLIALENNLNQNNTYLLRNAYRVIMAARNFFTGEEISYRIYYLFDQEQNLSSKDVGIFVLSEEEVLNLTRTDSTNKSLRLKEKLDNVFENKAHNKERESIFQKHWDNIFAGFKIAEWSKNIVYRVHKNIFEMYIGRNPQLWNKDNKRYNTFNRGNIYEAFDATAQDVYNPKPEQTEFYYLPELFHYKYFGTYLKHDTIKGFQTGDVDLTQIKAKNASLMEVRTLKIYLKEILELFKTTEELSKEKLKEKIRQLFTDPEVKNLDKGLDQYIDKKVDELFSFLQRY